MSWTTSPGVVNNDGLLAIMVPTSGTVDTSHIKAAAQKDLLDLLLGVS